MRLKAQTKWRWEHAIYLALVGIGTSAFAIGVVADFAGVTAASDAWLKMAKIGMTSGFILVGIGLIIVLIDLGKPQNAIHAWKKPNTSWISRGIIILTLFMVFGAINVAFYVWPFGAALEGSPAARHFLQVIGLILSLCGVSYAGFLLGANRPIAAWSTPMMPTIFLISGLYGGTCLVQLLSGFLVSDAVQPLKYLAFTILILGILQFLILGFYLQGQNRVSEARASTMMLMNGEQSTLFWAGVIVIGLLLPIIIELFAVTTGAGAGIYFIAGIAGILQPIFLRQAILASGIHAPLRAGCFEYALPKQ